MSPDELIGHCIESGAHLKVIDQYAGEPFGRCHSCGQPVVLDPEPGWETHGRCVQAADPEQWWPSQSEQVDAAKQVCAACPVLLECGAHGILHEHEGVWGGMSAMERRQIRRQLGISMRHTGHAARNRQARDERIRQLAAAGLNVAEIARQVDMDRRDVHRALRKQEAA